MCQTKLKNTEEILFSPSNQKRDEDAFTGLKTFYLLLKRNRIIITYTLINTTLSNGNLFWIISCNFESKNNSYINLTKRFSINVNSLRRKKSIYYRHRVKFGHQTMIKSFIKTVQHVPKAVEWVTFLTFVIFLTAHNIKVFKVVCKTS